jgi:hypothetical protein
VCQSVHVTTSQCWSMVTCHEILLVLTQDAAQFCIAERTPQTIHFSVPCYFVLTLRSLQLHISMLAVNYIRRPHISINELQPDIHLIIKTERNRSKNVDSKKHAEFLSHSDCCDTSYKRNKSQYVINSDVPFLCF